jgi:hypothetical protein
MESENILAINIPNMISITIMAVIGGLLLGLVSKAVSSARANQGG